MKHFILYVAAGNIFSCGPFDSENETLQYASDKNQDEFDIGDQHVYHLTPDQKLIELSASDLDSTKQKDEDEAAEGRDYRRGLHCPEYDDDGEKF